MAKTVIIAGVGPGSGAALARKFAKEKCQVGMIARSADTIQILEEELRRRGDAALAAPADITDPKQVADAFHRVREKFGPIDVLINHASQGVWKGLLELKPEEFEAAWRVSVYGTFLCTREAAPDMLRSGGGVVLFTGATSSIRGRNGALEFSSAKFAVRGLADSLARELWPKGIHVAHIVVDGVIDTPRVREGYRPGPDEPLLNPDAMAEAYWNLAQQPRGAWTLEIDLRPFNEEFFV